MYSHSERNEYAMIKRKGLSTLFIVLLSMVLCLSVLGNTLEAATSYTVSLNKNGGAGGTSSVKVTYGANMPSITVPTYTGHAFQGYYDTISGGTQYYTASGTSARTWNKILKATLYARWTTTSKNAIVFLPGYGGSRLSYGLLQMWEPNILTILSFERYLRMKENGTPYYNLTPIDDGKGPLDLYKKMIDALRKEYEPKTKVIYFPYDWRLNVADTAKKLQDKLSAYDNVYLVAHSMGGLVASSYIQQSTVNKNKVKLLITMGTPFTGSAKLIASVENGEFFDNMLDVFTGGIVQELAANCMPTYQLLPNNRHEAPLVWIVRGSANNETILDRYDYSKTMNFLKNRSWARTSTGAIKTMMNNGPSFPSSLIVNGVHAADSVPHLYIAGVKIDTRAIAVYRESDNNKGSYSLSRFEVKPGDGTVIESSARNGSSSNDPDVYAALTLAHNDLPKNDTVINRIKATINKHMPSSLQSVAMAYSLPEESTEDAVVPSDKRVTVIVEGANILEIFDKYGNMAFVDGESLYISNTSGEIKLIGSVWAVDYERNRIQYNLYEDDYSVRLAGLRTIGETPEVEIFYKHLGEQTSYKKYSDFNNAKEVWIDIRPEESTMDCY